MSTNAKDRQEFFAHFCENYWEKDDYVVADPPIEHAIAPDDLFHAVTFNIVDGLSARCSARFVLEGKTLNKEMDHFWEFMPNHGDGSFGGYNERLKKDLIGDKEYMLIFDLGVGRGIVERHPPQPWSGTVR